jgi:uncharacterized protein YqeY
LSKKVKLSTLLGEIQKKEANKQAILTDQEISGIIRQFINNLDEMIKNFGSRDFSSLLEEKELYSSYLPKSMEKTEIENYIRKIILDTNETKIGPIMGQLKKLAETSGLIYDGKIASEIIKTILCEPKLH